MFQIVLIIGASGFIGKHTIERLTSQGCTVYATHLPGEPLVSVPGVTWLPCDLNVPDFAAVFPLRCDSVIYLAQSPQWRLFPDGAADMFQVNVAAALRTAQYARHVGARRFIYVSSGSVYTQTKVPAHESEPFDLNAPRSFYIASKLAAELLLKPFADNFSVTILRLFVPYGVGQHPEMLIPQLVLRVRRSQALDLHGADGMQINPVAVADVAEGLERCLKLDMSATLNIAGPEVLTLREIGNRIGRVLGAEPHFQTHPDQSPPVIVGNTQTLHQHLGWAPGISFETGLRIWLQNAPAFNAR